MLCSCWRFLPLGLNGEVHGFGSKTVVFGAVPAGAVVAERAGPCRVSTGDMDPED